MRVLRGAGDAAPCIFRALMATSLLPFYISESPVCFEHLTTEREQLQHAIQHVRKTNSLALNASSSHSRSRSNSSALHVSTANPPVREPARTHVCQCGCMPACVCHSVPALTAARKKVLSPTSDTRIMVAAFARPWRAGQGGAERGREGTIRGQWGRAVTKNSKAGIEAGGLSKW